MNLVADPDPGDSPDVRAMFRHYDELYFRGVLVGAGFKVQWGSPRASGKQSPFGSCCFGKRSKTITLYESMLNNRTDAQVREALLHLMIHGILYVKHGRKCLGDHGPIFRDWMDAINSCSVEDHLRPLGGYCITITHDFSTKKSCAIQGLLWKCVLCGDTLVRAAKLGSPSDSCCIENADKDATCGNMLCYWHNHKINCGGIYVVSKPPKTPGQEKDPKVSSTINKERKLHNPGVIQKASVVPAAIAGKLKQDSVAMEKNKLFSFVGCSSANVQDNFSSKEAQKQREHDEIQKPTVLPAVPQSILKQPNKTQSSVKTEKRHKPEDYQRRTVQLAVPETTLKLSDRVAPEGQKTKGTTRKLARKEYVVVSVWQNIYESEGSSGSSELLVNKRTERRKRERERLFQRTLLVNKRTNRRKREGECLFQRTYSQSRKRSNSGISSIKTQPSEEDLSQQAKPPPPSLDNIIVIDPAD